MFAASTVIAPPPFPTLAAVSVAAFPGTALPAAAFPAAAAPAVPPAGAGSPVAVAGFLATLPSPLLPGVEAPWGFAAVAPGVLRPAAAGAAGGAAPGAAAL